MPQLQLKPTHKVVQDYYESLAKFEQLGIKHEGAVRSAFQTLLESCGRQFDWKLVPEYRSKGKAASHVQIDGALLDNYGLVHGQSPRYRGENCLWVRSRRQPIVWNKVWASMSRGSHI